MSPLVTESHRVDGHDVHEHVLTVPLDHRGRAPGTIEVFAREYVRDGRGAAPRLVFFQGGPGHPANRPDVVGGWLERALEEFRVVLLDQRGTGRSTPLDRQGLAELATPAEQARYLTHFRADSIVADAELLRNALGGDTWAALGQSYGGFCLTTYLSQAPHGLREVLITAGLPGIATSADDVYRATYAQTALRNEEFSVRYPRDLAVAQQVADHLDGVEEFLPTGERLSSRRFRTIGIALGQATGFDGLHFALEDPFTTVRGERRLRERFLLEVGRRVSFAAHPLYALLHESIYAQGSATDWAAHRVRAEFPAFALDAPGFRFTGEHVYPWQFEEDPALVPLRAAADLLAADPDLPPLYDADVLAENTVPVAAAVYVDDMFVPYEFSRATATAIRGARTFVTNEYQHDGLRVDGKRLLDVLLGLARR
ncbi:alpha/beta fold hydrolase [Kineococcus radiotolerans]|uniref:Alpha/beta hydrolase fold n=1 Tax=Kineococcus radiotolerans (strain ATCC BAA-149 / DSM 14245 / SRS30216) TaxID=266940 RepID=A6WEX7_KINRD|nr:alpha/beta fold hydrolase [Kineococcus radiotolerans]ABS05366.1 alpha/beta hydrolase fold [Kineococcus radiotolerans SRS30216 = ATCC BAA-149]